MPRIGGCARSPAKLAGARRCCRRAPLQRISRPVSRVLYGPPVETSERDGHSSGTPVARRVKQPTRMTGPDRPEAFAPRHSYSVLLPVGFAVPLPLPASAVRSYRTVSPLPRLNATHRGGLISVALSLKPRPAKGLTPPDVIRHRLSVEPGLSSPAAFRHWRGAAVRPTDTDSLAGTRSARQARDGAMVCKKKAPEPVGRGRLGRWEVAARATAKRQVEWRRGNSMPPAARHQAQDQARKPWPVRPG